MAYTPNSYTADGSTTEFAITFPFLREADVVVSVFDASGNVVSAFDFEIFLDGSFKARVVADGTITDNTPTALPANYTVRISRTTDISTLGTTFVDGVSLRAADINVLLNQQNYALQEAVQDLTGSLTKNATDTAWDAESLPLENLGAPVNDNDAMRKVDVDSGIGAAVSTVASIANDVTNVAADQADIGVVAADLNGSDTIGTVSGNIASVQNVSASIANVNTVAADTADIGTVAADIEVGGPDNIGTVAAGIGDVAIVAGINGPVQTVSTNIADVTTVATDLNGVDNTGTVATNIANVNTLAGISSDVTSLAPQASNISTLTQAANLTALQNAQSNAQAAQAALNQLNNKYHGSFTNVNGDDAEVEAAIAADSALSKEAGDLYFDSTNDKLRYYDGTGWYNAAATSIIDMTALSNAGDVASYTTNLADGSFLVYNGANWVDETPAQARASIGIDTSSIASGELLRWDGTSSFVPTSLTEDASGNVVAGGDIKASSFNGGQLGGRRNLIINGAMQVAQRKVQETGVTSDGYYTVDRVRVSITSLGTWTLDQSSDAPNGFANSFKVTCTNSSSLVANSKFIVMSRVEAQDLQFLGYGTSDAQSLTLSFYVKSNKTGNASVNLLQNDNSNKMVSLQYSILSADTWERKTLSIPADTSGLINNDNGYGLQLEWFLNGGSNFNGGSHNTSWTAFSNTNRNVSNLGIGGTVSDYFAITGVQLELGDTATPFEHRSYAEELALCQRYYQKYPTTGGTSPLFSGVATSGTQLKVSITPYGGLMRDDPAIYLPGAVAGNQQAKGNGTASNITAVSLAAQGGAGHTYDFTTSGLTTNHVYFVTGSIGLGAGLELDAEL